MLDRHDLTDEEWARLEPLLPSQKPQRGGRWVDHRTVINGVFWRTRCGLPWRDVPPNYGHWKTVYNRHRRWSADGVWENLLDELRRDADRVEGAERTVPVPALGYVLRGRMTYRFADHDETYRTGDAFYLPSGDVPVGNDPDTTLVQFSPTKELREVEQVLMKNLAALQGNP